MTRQNAFKTSVNNNRFLNIKLQLVQSLTTRQAHGYILFYV